MFAPLKKYEMPKLVHNWILKSHGNSTNFAGLILVVFTCVWFSLMFGFPTAWLDVVFFCFFFQPIGFSKSITIKPRYTSDVSPTLAIRISCKSAIPMKKHVTFPILRWSSSIFPNKLVSQSSHFPHFTRWVFPFSPGFFLTQGASLYLRKP